MAEVNAPSTANIGDGTNGGNNIDSIELGERLQVNDETNNNDVEPNPVDHRSSWTHIANNDDNDMVRQWKASPFAVGLTYPTWKEEPVKCCGDSWCFKPVNITAICCRYCCCVRRVGNMVVLLQRNTATAHRPKLLVVLGPYWMVLVFVTIPIFALLSTYTFISVTRNENSTTLIVLHLLTTSGLFISLFMVGCQDPGILYRYSAPPVPSLTTSSNSDETEWQWNDQALTYRPLRAKYDSECAVVIERFDHTCPWTGTAIGMKNMFWFRIFVVFVLVDILFNSIVLTLL